MGATVRQVIALAEELSDEERRIVVDAIAPKESIEELAREWALEIERRAARVRSGEAQGRPAAEVFCADRGEARVAWRSISVDGVHLWRSIRGRSAGHHPGLVSAERGRSKRLA
jgi:hypothetical protein